MESINKSRKEEFLILYNQGYNDYEIARRMLISNSTIFRWRKSFNLPINKVKLKSRNRKVELTEENKEILCGTLLGDASLQYYPKYRWAAPKYKCDHSTKQKEYAELINNKLSNLGSSIREYSRIDKRNNKEYHICSVQTKANPIFIDWYNELYNSGKKEITEKFLKNFTIKSLAYLYMDDGYADQKTAYICTDNFSQKSKEILVNYILAKFNLKFTVVNHGKYYRLRLSQLDFERFKALVSPYIIESLKYKLNTVS